ncbi:MAG: energy-coupling factor transporter transmembrane component T family protein [Spirochaetota bacterium]
MQINLYLPGTTVLHRFDPRVKLLTAFVFSIYTFLPIPFVWLLVLFACLMLLTSWTLGIREAVAPARSMWPLLIMIVLLTPPFYREDPLLITGVLLFRILTITTLFYQLFRTTPMARILAALRWFGLPYQAALVVTISMRYIPYLAGIYHQIQDAHRLRGGGESDDRRLRARLGRVWPVLTSVLIYAIKSVPLLSMSLESRGFGLPGTHGKGYKHLSNDRKLFTHTFIFVMIALIFTAGPVFLS